MELISIIILAITAIFAFRSAKQAAESNELKLLPVLTLKIEDLLDAKLTIHNISDAIAYDVEIDENVLFMSDTKEVLNLQIYIPEINVIEPRQKKDLKTITTVDGKKSDLSGMMLMLLQEQEKPIRIYYKNAKGKKYITSLRLYKKAIRIVEPPKKYTWRRKIRVGLTSYVISNFYKTRHLYKLKNEGRYLQFGEEKIPINKKDRV